MLEARRGEVVTATGTVHAGPGTLAGALLTSGAAAAAVAIVRTGGASGPVLCTLAAPQGRVAMFTPLCCLGYRDLHVTLTGADASFAAFV